MIHDLLLDAIHHGTDENIGTLVHEFTEWREAVRLLLGQEDE